MQTIRVTRPLPTLPEALTSVLPPTLTDAIHGCGASSFEELRLHSNRISTVISGGRQFPTGVILDDTQMREILQRMCGGSLYAFSQTINQGYLTMPGGIRVGVCGTAATEGGRIIGVSAVTGLVIRIPHRVPVDPAPIMERLFSADTRGGVLIYSPPGVGKTTLLRAIAESAASPVYARRTVVVDTREELQYTLDGAELSLDILVGYPREIGIEIAVRSLAAELVVCDEIGSTSDAHAILAAANCGVPLVASAHAASLSELLLRPAFRDLHAARVFSTYVGLSRDAKGLRYFLSENF